MDHQAFAQLLGNYGEFIGALAVVVTLAYLAMQIRQNSELAKSQLNTVGIEAYSRYREQANAHAEVVVKMQNEEALTDKDKVIATNIVLEGLFSSAMGYENSKVSDRSRQEHFVAIAIAILNRYNWPFEESAPVLDNAGFGDFVSRVQHRLANTNV